MKNKIFLPTGDNEDIQPENFPIFIFKDGEYKQVVHSSILAKEENIKLSSLRMRYLRKKIKSFSLWIKGGRYFLKK